MLSKIYSHRTNASRAARAAGLTKAPLIAVAGGYQFELPPSDGAIYKAVAEKAADAAGVPPVPAVETLGDLTGPEADDQPEPTEEEIASYYKDVTVPNGPLMIELTDEECAAITRTETALASTKPPRARAKAAKRAKPPTKAKAPRKPPTLRQILDTTTKRGTKAYADKMAARRRAGMNKRGITELVMKEIRTRWTPTSELLKMTGWQPTTLRGVLSLYAKKNNIEIKGRTVDGERQYLVAR